MSGGAELVYSPSGSPVSYFARAGDQVSEGGLNEH